MNNAGARPAGLLDSIKGVTALRLGLLLPLAAAAAALVALLVYPAYAQNVDEPQITLTIVPRSLWGSNHLVLEDGGTQKVGLRAETAGDVPPSENFDIVVRSRDLTAKAGLDFEDFSETYAFSAADFQLESGVYVQTVTHDLLIIDDEITEQSEFFGVEIDTDALPDHVTVAIRGGSGQVTIVDNDQTTISGAPPEPAEEGEDVVVTLRLDKLVSSDFVVALLLLPGTAARGDFGSVNSVNFNEGDTEATVRIPTVEDGLVEEDETFTLRLLDNGLPSGVNLPDPPTITLTIRDDDHAPVVETPSFLTTRDYTTAITTLSATDGDGDDLTWEITGGDDQGLFDLTEDGALSFTTLQSFDSPGDSDGDGTYHVHVRVTDGFNPVDHRLTIELEAAPPPRSLSARVADDGVVLTWLPPLEADADSVEGYEILRRRPNRGEREFTVLVSDTTNAETTYTDTTATETGVRYTYRVKAIRSGQRSEWSRFATAMRVEDVTGSTLVGNLRPVAKCGHGARSPSSTPRASGWGVTGRATRSPVS